MMFDYDNQPDADAIAVADAIRSQYRLPELTPEQQQQRRIDQASFREELAWRDEQRRIEHQERQDEADAIARAEQAAELAEHNRQTRERMRLEYQQRAQQRSRDLDLSALKFEAQQQGQWRTAVQQDLRAQYRNRLVGELGAMIAAQNAQPVSEPAEVIERDPLGSANFFDDDYNPNYYADKFAGKFKR